MAKSTAQPRPRLIDDQQVAVAHNGEPALDTVHRFLVRLAIRRLKQGKEAAHVTGTRTT